ncbi:MAG: AAA family ATPase [Promethearchaeota archaeon]
MIKKITIESFKSIKSLEFKCNRINVFIGPPNSGKSNILEALAYPCYLFMSEKMEMNLRDFIRYYHKSDLFYDNEVANPINIRFDDYLLKIKLNGADKTKEELFKSGKEISIADYQGPFFRYYKFIDIESFNSTLTEFLLPPNGKNLLFLLLTHKNLKEMIIEILKPFNLSLGLRKNEYKIEVTKNVDGITISYPYSTVSDTLKRLIFHIIAIETNFNSVLIFEEPEMHAFPHYSKFFAEKVALNKNNNNQYFFSTHNPYFLLSLLQKTNDVNVFATYWANSQTNLQLLDNEEILSYESDIFFNLDNIIEDAK